MNDYTIDSHERKLILDDIEFDSVIHGSESSGAYNDNYSSLVFYTSIVGFDSEDYGYYEYVVLIIIETPITDDMQLILD